MEANLDAGPDDQVLPLHPRGELGGDGNRLDALIAVRDQQIALLRRLIAIVAA